MPGLPRLAGLFHFTLSTLPRGLPPALLVALLPYVAAPPAAAKPSNRAERSAVEARLRAYELPGTPAEWRSLGAGVEDVLVSIGGDAKVDVLIRARAVSVLGYLPAPASRRFLEETIDAKAAAASTAADRLLLRKAAVALGWMGGLTVPGRLGPLLDNPDSDVRLDAAIGLGLTRLAAAADLLLKRFDVEPVARVRSQIGRQLKVVEDALAAIRGP